MREMNCRPATWLTKLSTRLSRSLSLLWPFSVLSCARIVFVSSLPPVRSKFKCTCKGYHSKLPTCYIETCLLLSLSLAAAFPFYVLLRLLFKSKYSASQTDTQCVRGERERERERERKKKARMNCTAKQIEEQPV